MWNRWFLENQVNSLHDTLGEFTKGKWNLDLIIYIQRASYDKTGLRYQPNKSFISICHDKKKTNKSLFKCNCCRKLGHFEPFYFSKLHDLRCFNGYDSRHLKLLIHKNKKRLVYQKQNLIYFTGRLCNFKRKNAN